MHYIMAALGAIAGAAYWWFYLKQANNALSDAVDTVGRVRGNMRRRKLVAKAELSPVSAIDDPVVGAATILYSIAQDISPVSGETEKRILGLVSGLTTQDQAEEAIIYARWASSKIAEPSVVIDRVSPLMNERLDDSEKDHLISMVCEIERLSPGWRQSHSANIARLRRKLNIQLA